MFAALYDLSADKRSCCRRWLPVCEAVSDAEAGFQFMYGYIIACIVIIFMCCNPQCQIEEPGMRPPEGA